MPIILGSIENIITLFAFGTFWFWALLIFFIIGSIVAEKNDSIGWLTFTLLVFSVFFIPNILDVISLKTLITGFVCYLVVGGVWSVVKWGKHVGGVVNKIRENAKYVYEWEISVGRNKTKIITWISAWPASMFWTLTHDAFEWVFQSLYSVYASITKRADEKIRTIIEEKSNPKNQTHKQP